MKRNDLNAIITGIVHRYIEDGWVLEMDNASYSDVVGVHFLSRGRERVAVGIRRPELKEVTESGRYANLRGLDSRRGDLLLCAEDRRQWGLLLGHELWKALGAAREGHRKTGGPSLIC